MANQNFVVQNGLQVGPLVIDATTGSITTTGNVTTTGTVTTFINEIVTGTEAVYGQLSANAGIGSLSTSTGTFVVTGGTGITGDVFVGGNLHTTGTAYLKVPAGTTAQRPGAANVALGMIRYNSTISSFEGYGAGSAWSSLGGVKSVDGYATITAEAFAGAGDDVLRFYSGSTGSQVQVAWASAANVKILPTTPASSTTTGALQVAGGAGIAGDLYVGGNISAASLNTVSSSQLSVTAPLVYLTGNPYPYNFDIGMYSHFIGGGANVYAHTGVVRNYSTGYWGFFSNVKSEPTGTVNWADSGIVWDTIQTGHVLPGANVTYNIGSNTAWWNTIYGKATQAQYADLAENYQADKQYTPGTVVMFGGENEVTVADADTTAVAGVVSTNPAHLMNGALTGVGVVALALQGRVPCNVIGPVKKGDMMVSAGFGYAKSSTDPKVGQVIGKALMDFPMSSKGVIEVVVGRV
jgi:hypothetical protein